LVCLGNGARHHPSINKITSPLLVTCREEEERKEDEGQEKRAAGCRAFFEMHMLLPAAEKKRSTPPHV
jgi:hypothetical protein